MLRIEQRHGNAIITRHQREEHIDASIALKSPIVCNEPARRQQPLVVTIFMTVCILGSQPLTVAVAMTVSIQLLANQPSSVGERLSPISHPLLASASRPAIFCLRALLADQLFNRADAADILSFSVTVLTLQRAT